MFIKADPNAIDRIVNNLIENAIKFSAGEGKIEVTLKTAGDKIHFQVKDAGIGIPPGLQKKIFEPYYQINHKKTDLQGMGLGLPIVKKVVDSLGGQIEIGSNPAVAPGTTISITLNRHIPTAANTPVVPASHNKALLYNPEGFDIADTPYHPQRRSLLLVEDNKAMLQFLLKKLSDRYNVFYALNGAEALKKLPQLPAIPDLIISDIMMDKMDGFSFAKAIREQSNYSHIPIILLSARSTPADKLKGLRSGAIDLVQKPFSFEELSQKIEALLDNMDKQKKAIVSSSIAHLKALQHSESGADNPALVSKFEQACKLYKLTSREIEIIGLIHKGLSYKKIGKALFIAERTVTKHVQNIFEKVGVCNKVELINKLHL